METQVMLAHIGRQGAVGTLIVLIACVIGIMFVLSCLPAKTSGK